MSGVLNIYKEAHWTSFDVVAKIRGICHVRKIGHAGTLDPAAEGVLPVCVGKATRIADLLSGEIKTYRAQMKLGEETDTLDQTGTVVRRADPAVLDRLTEGQVREVIDSFVGGYDQVPPMYSARHVQGKRLYELAREGKNVDRAAVPVRIDRIVIDEIKIPDITLTVTCGRGTYIRSLCADIGEKLGCGGVMTHLVRTRVGPFEI
ncbi:MAG: tRNA pseudouridine(55) synthase TruB, partial [Lachnospiraceae bacterium]|nr:tRNA pseudouridine(55) synthase TruB [Lachnospiraceae bacterium]